MTENTSILTQIINDKFAGNTNEFRSWAAKPSEALDGRTPAAVLSSDPNFGPYAVQVAAAHITLELKAA